MSTHSALSGLQLHEPYHFVQETDPGAVGAGKYWLQVSTGIVKRRDTPNTGWGVVGGSPIPFTSLTDVPSSYVAHGGKSVRVNAGATGLEFFTPPSPGATVFTGLTDAPANYAGAATKVVAVNGAGTGLEFIVAGGINYVTVPSLPSDPGTIGDYAIDEADNKLYFYSGTTWKYLALLSFTGFTTLTWVSNGDTNGAFYYIATEGLTITWANPFTAGKITGTVSGALTGGVTNTVDRSTAQWISANAANSYITWDLGAGVQLQMTSYTLRGREDFSGDLNPRNWIMQGSNNGSTWTTLDTRTADATVGPGTGTWGKFDLGVMSAAYRYFRLEQTGLNAASNNYLVASEVEFYGDIHI